MSDELLKRLVGRGDLVALEKGRIEITPKSGREVTNDWLKKHYWQLVKDILLCTGRQGYRYDRFSRSSDGYGNGKYPGVTLHYEAVLSEEEAYLIFNVEVQKRYSSQLRTGKSFLPPERGEFIKYWKRAIGELPQGKRSKCWESMSRFKPIVVDLAPDYKGKARNKTALPIDISSDRIIERLADEIRTNRGPYSHDTRTDTTNHGIAQELDTLGIEPNRTTCNFNYETSYQDNALTRQESTEGWLRDYDADPYH